MKKNLIILGLIWVTLTHNQPLPENLNTLPIIIGSLTLLTFLSAAILTFSLVKRQKPPDVCSGTKLCSVFYWQDRMSHLAYRLLRDKKDGWTYKNGKLHNGNFSFEFDKYLTVFHKNEKLNMLYFPQDETYKKLFFLRTAQC